VVNQPTGREWHENHASEEDSCWEKLKADREKPSGFMLGVSASANIIGSIVDPEGYHNTKADGQLLKGNQRSSDLWGGDLCVVHWHDHAE